MIAEKVAELEARVSALESSERSLEAHADELAADLHGAEDERDTLRHVLGALVRAVDAACGETLERPDRHDVLARIVWRDLRLALHSAKQELTR